MGHDERERFEGLYRDNVRPVLSYALSRTDIHRAHDVVSSTFLVAWRRMDHVPPDEPLPWLIGVARRVLAEQRRSESRSRSLRRRLSTAAATSRTQVEDVAEIAALNESVRSVLERLRPVDRDVVILVAWHGFSTEQLAIALGCSKSVASLRLHRARRRFALLLDRQDQTAGVEQTVIRPAREIQ